MLIFSKRIKIFVHNVGRMLESVASPSKKLALHVYVEGIAIAQATTSTHVPRMKSHKFDPNVKLLFQLEASEDKGAFK